MARRGLIFWLILLNVGLLASCSSSGLLSSARPPVSGVGLIEPSVLPDFKHVFIIVLENKSYDKVVNSKETPYLGSLARQYGLATNYYGVTHPSLPNYLALTGGSTFNITTDCIDCTVAQPNLVDQLEQAGKSWKAYMESMPSPCFVGDAGPLYRQKHNPFIYYDSVRTNPDRCNKIVPFTQFAADLQASALPDFVWITPNMCADTHDCPLESGDGWLKTWVPQVLASPAWKDDGVLFITFDEGDHSEDDSTIGQGGHIATLAISPLAKPGYRSPVAFNHYSLLRTLEDAWHMPALGEAEYAHAMADFFTSTLMTERRSNASSIAR
jgi:phosphatidylinositol-3-phosphatase